MSTLANIKGGLRELPAVLRESADSSPTMGLPKFMRIRQASVEADALKDMIKKGRSIMLSNRISRLRKAR